MRAARPALLLALLAALAGGCIERIFGLGGGGGSSTPPDLGPGDGCHPGRAMCWPAAAVRPRGGAIDAVIDGRRAFALGGSEMIALDLADPFAPVSPGNVSRGGFALALDGDLLYVAEGGALLALDVSVAPIAVAAEYPHGFAGTRRVAVEDGRAYVALGSLGVIVIDLSWAPEDGGDPLLPAFGAPDARDVAVRAGALLIASGGQGLWSYRKSADSNMPGRVATDGDAAAVFFIDDRTAVVGSVRGTDDVQGSLLTVDVSDPMNPRAIAPLPLTDPIAFAVDERHPDGPRAYVLAGRCLDGEESEDGRALHAVGLFDPTLPVEIACCPFPGRAEPPGARGLAASGDLVLVARGQEVAIAATPGDCLR